MALSLGIHPGARFQIGDSRVSVLRAGPGAYAILNVEGKPKNFNVRATERVMILPQVYVSFGIGPSGRGSQGARLCFEAPREIGITRL